MNDAFARLDSKWTLLRGVRTQNSVRNAEGARKKAIYEKQLGIKGRIIYYDP
jgi:hypothetical protein